MSDDEKNDKTNNQDFRKLYKMNPNKEYNNNNNNYDNYNNQKKYENNNYKNSKYENKQDDNNYFQKDKHKLNTKYQDNNSLFWQKQN